MHSYKLTPQQTDFDNIFKRNGGLLTDDVISDDLRLILPDIKEFAGRLITHFRGSICKTLPDIHIDFIKSSTLNAAACSINGKHYIGINVGTYMLILDMFMKIFATDNLLAEIGNVGVETGEKKVLSAKLINGAIAYTQDIYGMVGPNDKIRRDYAVAFSTIVFQFLIYHEVGHIVHGHTAILNSKSQLAQLCEMDFKTDPDGILPALDRQTMEFDADAFAVKHSYIMACVAVEMKQPIMPHLLEQVSSLNNYFTHWYFAIYCFFRLFGSLDHKQLPNRISSHPAASLRLEMVLDSLSRIIVADTPNPQEIISNVFPSIRKASAAYSAITFIDDVAEDFLKIWEDPISTLEVARIVGNWNDLRPKLEKFALVELPPIINVTTTFPG